MYIVILAGGGGTRLRPLSRPERPKPFLPLVGRETLLQRTVERVASLGDVYCVADRRYGALIGDQAPRVRLIAEPAGRNTAAAIALATAAIERPDDEVMVVLPADHWVEREDVFRGVLEVAAQHLATSALGVDDPLVTLGVQPTGPSTDYGYLRPDVGRGGVVAGLQAYRLRAFEEKPPEARARELLETPGVAWNAGMFAWRRRAIREALSRYTSLPGVLAPAVESAEALAAAYEQIEPISIDYAVMEPAARDGRVLMGAMDVGWSDLGSWTALLSALGEDGRGAPGRVVETGESVEAAPGDLLVRPRAGRLVVEEAGQGTIVADSVWAHLAGASHLGPQVRALLDRVERQEARV